MNTRLRAAKVIARRRLFESLLNPGLYIAATIGLLIGYLFVQGFVAAVGSSGFSYSDHPVYDLIGRSITGVFGETLVSKVFAEGPFQLALYVAFLPVFLFLSLSSVFRFGLEKKVGAVELIAFGPADGTSYFLASFAVDLLLTIMSVLLICAFFSVAAALNNLVLGPAFFYNLPLIILFSAAVYAYGVLASVASDNITAAIALFIGVLVFFLIVMVGSFSIVTGYVQSLAQVLAGVVNWISPFHYWNWGLQGMRSANLPLFLSGIILLLVLSAAALVISHFIIKRKGVRA